ncbi:MAG: hypothetical protein WCI55_07530 [Armatimonadota bacterium]
MNNDFLGRTNAAYPKIWAALGVSPETSPEDLVAAIKPLNIPMDISSQPALWGGFLRGGTGILSVKSSTHYERATSQDHATDLMQAHLIEVLSSLGREMIDFYFLRVRRVVEEYQINGALAALEFAKQEGHVKHIGIAADGPVMAVQSVWQFHDAFEVALLRPEHESLANLAKERRVGVVRNLPLDLETRNPDHTYLVGINSQSQVDQLRISALC